MATGFGYNSWIGLGLETTYGTPVSRTSWFRLISVDIKPENPSIFKQFLGTALDRHIVKSKKTVSGSFTIAVPYAGFGFILKHALGAVSTTGSGPYTHAFTCAALPLAMTVEVNSDTRVDLYAGCKITGIKITAALEDHVQCEVSILGRSVTNVSASTPTFPTDTFIDWTAAGTMSIGGSSYSLKMTECEVTNELTEDRYFLGSQLRSEPKRKGGMVKFKAELELDGTTHQAALMANTSASLSFAFGSTPTALTLALADSAYQSVSAPIQDTGEIIESLEFEGNLADLTLTLINGDSSY